MNGNITIWYSGQKGWGAYSTNCWCTRWETDYNTQTIETIMTSTQRNTVFNHIMPGLVNKNSTELGWEIITDGTFNSGNTLKFEPISDHGISDLRDSRTVVINGIQDEHLSYDKFVVKFDALRIREWGDY